MIHRLRLASGLVLFSFVLCHFLNHALGLLSLGAMDRGLVLFLAVWGTVPGLAVLAGAALIHAGIALLSIWRRRHLRLHAWEAVQLGLGLLIPPLLVEHVLGTRLSYELYGVEANYAFIQYIHFVASPARGTLQAVLILVAWIHGCIGLHYWLRTKPWYGRAVPLLYAGALLVPTLALSGFLASGMAVMDLAAQPGWVGRMLGGIHYDRAASAMVGATTWPARFGFIGLVAAVFAARGIRVAVRRRRGVPRLTYPNGRTVDLLPGATVLETSRAAGIPHASVCGGRGRCSTCRVRVGEGADGLPSPSADEQRVLRRVGAPPNVRLACQLRPTASLEVTPLLPPSAGAREGFQRPGYLAGQEREIAILFADLRGFTRLSDAKLPFDVVFLLNRYFAAMGTAIEQAGGRVDKFIGDGIMALFGVDSDANAGSQQALRAARAMGRALDRLNHELAADLPEPLRMGIGIHAGPAIVGEMGHGRTKSLTAIGDAVNTASRLEGLTKEFGAQLVVSEAVARHAGIDLGAFPAQETAVRGKRETVPVRVIAEAASVPDSAMVPA